MSWDKERILVLAEASPNWSEKYGSYLICTAGINEDGEWRRLYPVGMEQVQGAIHRWNFISTNTTKPDHDPRIESRKINPEEIEVDGILPKEERRHCMEKLCDVSLERPLKERRSLTLVKPEILDFVVHERKKTNIQLTLDGKVFNRQPFGDVGLYYKWRCEEPCAVCANHPHMMECFDWGAHILYQRYLPNKELAREKTTDLCLTRMKNNYDTWFVLGTHSKRPFSVWMIVSLIWMAQRK